MYRHDTVYIQFQGELVIGEYHSFKSVTFDWEISSSKYLYFRNIISFLMN